MSSRFTSAQKQYFEGKDVYKCVFCGDSGVRGMTADHQEQYCDCEKGLRVKAEREFQCAICTFKTQDKKAWTTHYDEMHRGTTMVRDVENEITKVQTGHSKAVSSHSALFYNLISPSLIRRLALRKTVGGKKYGKVQWRQGINDQEYVADRFNHLVEHLLCFMEDGNTKDDNIGGMVWALDCLSEVERLCPDALKSVVGMCNLFGESAEAYHQDEMQRKERFHGKAKDNE